MSDKDVNADDSSVLPFEKWWQSQYPASMYSLKGFARAAWEAAGQSPHPIETLVGKKLTIALIEPSNIENKYKQRTVDGVVNSCCPEMMYLCIKVTSSNVVLEDI